MNWFARLFGRQPTLDPSHGDLDARSRRSMLWMAQLTREAISANHPQPALTLWRIVAATAIALAVRARGYQVQIDGTWLVLYEPESPCSRLVEAHAQLHHWPIGAVERAKLYGLRESCIDSTDPVLRMTRALADAALELSTGRRSSPADATLSMLGELVHIAREFEAWTPRLPEPASHGEREMHTFAIGAPIAPSPGEEVAKAIQHCVQMYNRLVAGGGSHAFVSK